MPDENDDDDRCVDCGAPAVGERLVGMVGEFEIVDRVCYDHLPVFA